MVYAFEQLRKEGRVQDRMVEASKRTGVQIVYLETPVKSKTSPGTSKPSAQPRRTIFSGGGDTFRV